MAAKPYAVVREVWIDAAPEAVHAHVNDLRRWASWAHLQGDGDVRRSFSGPDAGVGATFSWQATRRARAGRMEISASTPEVIDVDVHFERPLRSQNQTEFRFAPESGGTRVTWTMHGELHGVLKVLSMLFRMDRFLGADLAKGLQRLKDVVEAEKVG